MYCSLIPGRMQESLSAYIVQSLQQMHVSNGAWGCWGILMKKQSFIFLDMQLWTPLTSLVVTDFLSCGWPVVGTNFSEWFQKFIPGGTNFRGVQIKRDSPTQRTAAPECCVIDQGDFEAMKTLRAHRAPCCDKHRFVLKWLWALKPFSRYCCWTEKE